MPMLTHPFHLSLKRNLVAAAWLAMAGAAIAQTVAVPDWQAALTTPLTSIVTDRNALALDAGGNAYLASTGPFSCTLNRYSAAGVLQWTRTAAVPAVAGLSKVSQCSVVTDPNGNAIVVGDALAAKYGADGTLLWFQEVSATATSSVGVLVAIDASGDVVVARPNSAGSLELTRRSGTTGAALWTSPVLDTSGLPVALRRGALRLNGAQVVVSSGHDAQLVIASFAMANGALVGRQTLNVPGTTSDLAIGPSGEVAVVGSISYWLWGNGYNVYLFDSSLATTLFAKSLPDGKAALRVAMDAQRNVYVTGLAVDPNSTPVTSPFGTVAPGPWSDWLTVKLDPTGTLLWTARMGQRTDTNEAPQLMRLAADGGVIVAGQGGLPGSATPATQSAAVKYAAANGAALWSAMSNAALDAVDLKEAADSSLFVVGASPMGLVQHYAGLAKPSAVSFASSSITGGKRVLGTVRLSNNAGAVVKLASSKPSVASVPASVTIPAGATSASFSITTYRVRSTTAVSISASANGGITSATLNIKR
ncbi:MAG: hypothetical protein KA375_07725 [Vitreoscilla sp.]|nr:hypothetical protein [Vitreoscilla sp.]MBP6676228.1 hypothetical protein [Vitreoscilla sp.]